MKKKELYSNIMFGAAWTFVSLALLCLLYLAISFCRGKGWDEISKDFTGESIISALMTCLIISLLAAIPILFEYASKKRQGKESGKETDIREEAGQRLLGILSEIQQGGIKTRQEMTVERSKIEDNYGYLGIYRTKGQGKYFTGYCTITVTLSNGEVFKRVLPSGWEEGANVFDLYHNYGILCEISTTRDADKVIAAMRGATRQKKAVKLTKMLEDLHEFQMPELTRRYIQKIAFPAKGKEENVTEVFIDEKIKNDKH